MLIILLAEISDEHLLIRTRGRSETTEMIRSDYGMGGINASAGLRVNSRLCPHNSGNI